MVQGIEFLVDIIFKLLVLHNRTCLRNKIPFIPFFYIVFLEHGTKKTLYKFNLIEETSHHLLNF